MDRVCSHLGSQVISAETTCNDTVALRFTSGDRTVEQLEFEHIIAATGYRVDVKRLPFLMYALIRKSGLGHAGVVVKLSIVSPGSLFCWAGLGKRVRTACQIAVGAKFTATRLSRHFASAK